MANAEAFWDCGNVLFLNLGASDTDCTLSTNIIYLMHFPICPLNPQNRIFNIMTEQKWNLYVRKIWRVPEDFIYL